LDTLATAQTVACSRDYRDAFALNIAMASDHPSSAFYLPFTRAGELLVGALHTQIPRQGQRMKEALGACGLSAALVSFFLFDAHTKPGWAAALDRQRWH
jgi:peptidoglycan/LPS O-acetylase OafA/YrhL